MSYLRSGLLKRLKEKESNDKNPLGKLKEGLLRLFGSFINKLRIQACIESDLSLLHEFSMNMI